MTKDDEVSEFAKIFTDPSKSPLQRYAGIYGLRQGPDESEEQFRQRIGDHALPKETLEELIELIERTGDLMSDPDASPEEAQSAYDDHVRYIKMLESISE